MIRANPSLHVVQMASKVHLRFISTRVAPLLFPRSRRSPSLKKSRRSPLPRRRKRSDSSPAVRRPKRSRSRSCRRSRSRRSREKKRRSLVAKKAFTDPLESVLLRWFCLGCCWPCCFCWCSSQNSETFEVYKICFCKCCSYLFIDLFCMICLSLCVWLISNCSLHLTCVFFVCLFVCLFVCFFVSLFVCLFVCLFVSLFLCFFVFCFFVSVVLCLFAFSCVKEPSLHMCSDSVYHFFCLVFVCFAKICCQESPFARFHRLHSWRHNLRSVPSFRDVHGLCTRMTRRPYRDQKRRVRLAW